MSAQIEKHTDDFTVPRELLWDVHAPDVSWNSHREFIIGRILARGDVEHIRMLGKFVGDEALRAHLRRTRGRAMERKRLRFFENILQLSSREVDDWLADPARRIWDNR